MLDENKICYYGLQNNLEKYIKDYLAGKYPRPIETQRLPVKELKVRFTLCSMIIL
jgi:hypothetical protein